MSSLLCLPSRLLEEGKVEEAQNEKERVEQLQRDARAERQARGEEWRPRFFRYVHEWCMLCGVSVMWSLTGTM